MARQRSFAHQIRLGFFVLALLAVGTTVTAYISLRAVTESYEDRTRRQGRDLVLAESLRSSLAHIDSLVRGYLMSREPTLRNSWSQAEQSFQEALTQLLNGPNRDPAQKQLLARVSLLELEYRRAIDRAILAQDEVFAGAPLPDAPLMNSLEGVRRRWEQELEGLRSLLTRELNRLNEQLGEEIGKRTGEAARASRRAMHGIAILGTAAILIVLALLVVVNRLLTSWRVAEDGLRKQQLAQKFLAEASEVLSRSLDVKAVLKELGQLFVPRISDFSAIYIAEEDGRRFKRISVSCLDPELEPVAEQMLDQLAVEAQGGTRVLKQRQAVLIPSIHLSKHIPDAKSWLDLDRLAIHALIIVPIMTADRVSGTILLGSRIPGAFGSDELSLTAEIGRRAGYTIENSRLYEEAQRAVSVRDEFLSIASHELKTPLTSLYLQLQLLLRSVRGQPDAQLTGPNAAMLLESCRAQSRRLGRLIDELLDLTRIRAGKLELKIEDVDLTTVVSDVMNRLGTDLLQSGSEIQLEIQPGVLGRWDRTRMDQVVTNLVSNALKYGQGKPIRVSLERDEVQGVARLCVADQGIGISPENQTRIFERFERAINSKHISGLGLGLYIVKQIVEAMGGRIRVDSQSGQGSSFIVELPLFSSPPLNLFENSDLSPGLTQGSTLPQPSMSFKA